jgi:hypothetical protein
MVVMIRLLDVASSLGGLEEKQLQEVDMRLMWTGAALVLFGIIEYAIGSRPVRPKTRNRK